MSQLSSSSSIVRDHSLLERLEERVMFDAAPDAGGVVAENGNGAAMSGASVADDAALIAHPSPTAEPTAAQNVHVLFVDANLEDAEARIAEILATFPDQLFQVQTIDQHPSLQATIEQISQQLSTAEAQSIGSVWLLIDDQAGADLLNHAADIAQWSDSLVADGSIVIQGNLTVGLAGDIERLTGITTVSVSEKLASEAANRFAATRDSQNQPTEVIVVDPSVRGYEQLVTEILKQRDADILILDHQQDGIEQIAQWLSGRTNLQAIHLISHGSEGELRLGAAALNAQSMQQQYGQTLVVIGQSLDADGDILIYGCDFTAGDAGLQAAILLGGLTGADIAASQDATGHVRFGGNWTLETTIGDVQTSMIQAAAWQGLLAPPTVSVPVQLETLEDVAITFGGTELIVVGSDEAAALTLTLRVLNGQLAFANTTGITFLNATVNGSAELQVSGTIAALNTALAGLVYTPEHDYFGNDTLSVTADDGNTTTTQATAISIASQNDVPVIVVNLVNADSTGTPSETTEHVFTLNDFRAIDPDNSDNQLTFVLNSLPTVGQLRFNGYPVTTGTVFTQAQVASGALRYVHNGGEIHADSFALSVNDGAGGQHGPVLVSIMVTPINDPMSVSAQGAVYEGGSTRDISPGAGKPTPGLSLSISDAETDDKRVTITSLPGGGVLYYDGTAVTASSVSAGFTIRADQFHLLEYRHDGIDDLGTHPSQQSFNIVVFDEGGGTSAIQSVPTTVALHVISVNDELELVHYDDSIHPIPIDGHYVLSLADMHVTDPDGPDSLVTYTVENVPSSGILRISGQMVGNGATFTQAQLEAGQVVFYHRNGGTDRLEFTARDGQVSILTNELGALREGDHLSPRRVLTLNFELEPRPDTGGSILEIEILEGHSQQIADFETGDLVVFDELPEHGVLLLNGTAITLGQSMTFAAGDVLIYQHNGEHIGSDGFRYTENGDSSYGRVVVLLVNDPPQLEILQPLTTVYEGQVHEIDENWLHASDEETTNPIELIYTITGYPAYGDVLFDGVALEPFASFSHQDVLDNRIAYQHNGGERFVDQIVFELSDGALTVVRTLPIQAIPVNDQPVITASYIQLFEGDTAHFTPADLGVADVDGQNSDLPIAPDTPIVIQIDSLPTHGTLWYNHPDDGPVLAHIGLTLVNTDVSRLSYQHDGDEQFNDSFRFTVIDNNKYETLYDAVDRRPGEMTISVIPVNDPPEVIVNEGLINDPNGDRRVYEGGSAVITTDVLTSVDPDSTDEQIQYRILAPPAHGKLFLNGVAMSTGSSFTQVQLAAGNVTYRHDGSETAADSFQFQIDDSASNVAPETFHIEILAVNDAPTIQAPGAVTVNQIDFQFTGANAIRVSDVDAGSGNVAVTLTASDPLWQLRVTSAVGVIVTGDDSGTLVLHGELAAVNAALATLHLRASDLNGPASLTIHISDQGNSGVDPSQVDPLLVPGLVNTGGNNFEEATRVVQLLVSTTNDPQVNTVPPHQTMHEDGTLAFGTAFGNAIRVDDPDSFDYPIEVTLSVDHGVLSLSQTSGLTFVSGSGTNATSMTFVGSQAAVNAALNGLVYAAPTNYIGDTVLNFTTNDLNNTGDGGPHSRTNTIDLTILAVNDSPTVTAGVGPVAVDGATAVPGFVINDPDYSDGTHPASTDGEADFMQVTVRLLPSTGNLPLSETDHADVFFRTTAVGHGATIDNTFDGIGSALVIRGTRAEVNAYLSGLTVELTAGLVNSDQLYRVHVVADDRLRDSSGNLDGTGLANGGPNPAPGGGTLSVPSTNLNPYGAIDSGLLNNLGSGTRTVIPTSTNEAPTLGGMPTTRQYTEGTGPALGAPVVLAPAGTVSDPELGAHNNWQHATLIVQRQGGNNSEDIFGVTGSGNTGVNISGASIWIGTTEIGTVTNANGVLIIEITQANTTTTQVNTILQAITYANSSQMPPEQVNIQFVLSDGDTDPDHLENPQGKNGALTGQAVIAVDIVSVNDAPVLSNINPITHVESNGPVLLGSGATAFDQELTRHGGGDGDWGHATLTLSRNGAPNAQDQFGSQGALSPLTEGGILVLGGVTVGTVITNSGGVLELVFAEGTTTDQVNQVMRLITYDNSSQSLGSTSTGTTVLRWTINDGDTEPDRIANPQGVGLDRTHSLLQTINRIGVNDAPQATNFERTINQDNPYVFHSSDFGFQDLVDAPADQLLNVIISSLPTDGRLLFDGIPVSVDQVISATAIDSGRLVFVPDAGEGGPFYSSFQFHVQDDGGTAHGGVDVSALPNLATIHVNRAPVVIGAPLPDLDNEDAADFSTFPLNLGSLFQDPEGHSLSFAAEDLPSGLVIDPNTGVITGRIDSDASVLGSYDVVIKVTDELGAVSEHSFVWSVTNPAPRAVDDFTSTYQNTPISGTVLGNDEDPDDDHLVVDSVITFDDVSYSPGTPVVGSGGGVFVINADGSFTFDPGHYFDQLAEYETSQTFVTYMITDNQGGFAKANLHVTVFGLNDAPISSPLSPRYSMDNETVSIEVRANFFDIDQGELLMFSDGGTLPPGLAIHPFTGRISGTIHSNASTAVPDGIYSVSITAADLYGETTQQTFVWTVTNPPPTAVNDQFDAEGRDPSAVVGNAIVNDSDPDGDSLQAVPQTLVPGSHGGLFSIAADGSVTFDPNGDFNHITAQTSLVTSLAYTVIDSDGGTSVATIEVRVTGGNHAPNAVDDHVEVINGPIAGNALENDSDADGDALVFSVNDLPVHGTLVWNPDGSFVYTPGPSYTGSDHFTYTVTDVHGASSTATVFINRSFAWDSVRNEAWSYDHSNWMGRGGSEQLLSHELDLIASQPMLAGSATPGAILKARIYHPAGYVIAEATTRVDAAGNWLLSFYEPITLNNAIVIIDHIASEEVLLGELNDFQLSQATYRSMQLGAQHATPLSPASILSDRPSAVLERMHQQNLSPLRLR